jgi:hypothetical protein
MRDSALEAESRLELDDPAGKSPRRFAELLIADRIETIAAGDKRSVVEKSETGQVKVVEDVEEIESKIESRPLSGV